MSSTKSVGKSTESVHVVVRCRPLSTTEKTNQNQCIVQVNTDRAEIIAQQPNNINSTNTNGSIQPVPVNKAWPFDHVYPMGSQQADIYNTVCKPIVESVLNGYNGTIFAYGQTGTGKVCMELLKNSIIYHCIIYTILTHYLLIIYADIYNGRC